MILNRIVINRILGGIHMSIKIVDEKMREKIIKSLYKGYTQDEILDMPEILCSKSTIKVYIKKWKEQGLIKDEEIKKGKEERKIMEDVLKGEPYVKIAMKYGCSTTPIYNVIERWKKQGLVTNQDIKRARTKEEREREIMKDVLKGESYNKIAMKHDCSTTLIYNVIERWKEQGLVTDEDIKRAKERAKKEREKAKARAKEEKAKEAKANKDIAREKKQEKSVLEVKSENQKKEIYKVVAKLIDEGKEIPDYVIQNLIEYCSNTFKEGKVDSKNVDCLAQIIEFTPELMIENNINLVVRSFIKLDNPERAEKFIKECNICVMDNRSMREKLCKIESVLANYIRECRAKKMIKQGIPERKIIDKLKIPGTYVRTMKKQIDEDSVEEERVS